MNKTQRIAMLSFFVCVIFLMNIFIVSGFSCGTDTVQDVEGNTYNTVRIDTQCWMKENLNVGTKVTGVTTQTDNALIEKYCYDDNDSICITDGGLYLWDEAMQYVTTVGTQGICPSGWHIPTDAEQYTLEKYFATGTCDATRNSPWDCDPAGTALKVGGSSGFEGIIAGYRDTNGGISARGTFTYFWSSTNNGVSASWGRSLFSSWTTVQRGAYSNAYGFSVRCLYDENVTAPTIPTYTNFTSAETTNFSEATLSSVTNLTLAIESKGKIKFPVTHSINSENEDYDTNIVIEDKVIFVNSSALDSSFNSSAILTFYNVDCNKPYVFYSETASTFASILSENHRCPDSLCSNILCADSTLTVDVEHFTGFAAGSNANLTTEAQAGIFYPLDPIEFTAAYINSTDGTPISGECNITFDDEGTWYTMDFDSTDYNYTRSFATSGLHEYNVTCSNASFVTLEANDTKVVSPTDIPEFSTVTLGLGLIAVLAGLFIIRKKK